MILSQKTKVPILGLMLKNLSYFFHPLGWFLGVKVFIESLLNTSKERLLYLIQT